jgi:hypothetical protein
MPMFVDDRTQACMATLTVLIAGTDKVLSGSGLARNGRSIAIWACKPEDAATVERWVASRTDMSRVRKVRADFRGKKTDHVHVYCVHADHPALGKGS